MKNRQIGIFTGNRAEYGLLAPIVEAVTEHPKLDYQLIVSGAHLDKEFGETLKEIEKDGYKISGKIDLKISNDNLLSTVQCIALCISELSKLFEKLNPDILVVYADRYEGFAAIIAASQLGIPVAHIEGGDVTEGGALDDSVRHAMTKLSHLHFTTNKEAKARVLAMGEENWRVVNSGLPALDFLKKCKYANCNEISTKLKLDINRPIVIFTQHSVTTEYQEASNQVCASLEALGQLAAEGVQVIITFPNNDAGGKDIIQKITEFSNQQKTNVQVIKSLGRHLYHGLLALSLQDSIQIVCVGNSSSGIKETPAFFCPTVNIGTRQNGRLRSTNIIDVDYNKSEIYEAIKTSLFDQTFRKICRQCKNPYGRGDAGKKIAAKLASVNLGKTLLIKKMTY